ncbi:sarcosine oxidase subunit delta [Cohaesibacter gelatinilyticus]|uniref:Sarcosine oxidase subunit delta n=1 Tax=Cohaesibacter gelatinilyticus TaxID=372072 RepID=A0A285NDE4_9HYPH|nr:sarcosine oxidase subunit delta [Cohaesibacter gelatinilyticus]SNZ07480.1 sarcosine oxidase subunit delta [Cohaesibacter gelatinilyticus]HAT87174.1 sarcosine oxidase subunit delta family protein [Hyphomicrobiales bacterium]
MLKIECPYCGERDEVEFHYGGEAHIARPEDPESLDDKEWADFLFMRTNTKGWFRERWVHTQGCRRWFNVVRHTVTHEIMGSYKAGEKPNLKDLKGKGK